MSQAVIDTFAIGSALGDDRYTFTYSVIDSAGNTSTESAGMNVFVDATAPTAPSNPDLRADNDKGTLDDDNLTNISDLFFNGIEPLRNKGFLELSYFNSKSGLNICSLSSTFPLVNLNLFPLTDVLIEFISFISSKFFSIL